MRATKSHVFIGHRIVEREHRHSVPHLLELAGGGGADPARQRIGRAQIGEFSSIAVLRLRSASYSASLTRRMC